MSAEPSSIGVRGAKHLYAATVARAKSAPCAGCGERRPRRELVEVHPEHQDFGHEVLEGERYCRPCARHHGVL